MINKNLLYKVITYFNDIDLNNPLIKEWKFYVTKNMLLHKLHSEFVCCIMELVYILSSYLAGNETVGEKSIKLSSKSRQFTIFNLNFWQSIISIYPDK